MVTRHTGEIIQARSDPQSTALLPFSDNAAVASQGQSEPGKLRHHIIDVPEGRVKQSSRRDQHIFPPWTT
jgi:hypothetical protein